MTARGATGRLISPVGFMVALICFAFPFVAVSCESPDSKVTVEYTGIDLAAGGDPAVTVDGVAKPPDDDIAADAQLLMILALIAVVCGLAVTVMSALRLGLAASPRWAAAGCAAAATVASGLLVANQLVVTHRIVERLTDGGRGDRSAAEKLVETRPAFWVAALFLCIVVVAGSAEFLWRTTKWNNGPATGNTLPLPRPDFPR